MERRRGEVSNLQKAMLMIQLVVSILILIPFISCDQVDRVLNGQTGKDVSYSFACIDTAVGGKPFSRKLNDAGDLIRDLAVSEGSITDSVQTQYGRAFHNEMVGTGTFKLIKDAALSKKLNTALNDLLRVREKPSGIGYQVYALEDKAVNAFTFGGRIYVTRGMLEKCTGNESLLYAIIGHEIGHSETGHIKATIQDLQLSDKIFGEGGSTFFEIKKLLTASFNQRNELEADYYGINLTNALGYDVCTAVAFWKEMASKENTYNEVEDFFRSHPFSDLRSRCLTSHIRTNFGKECGGASKANALPQVVK